MFYDTGSTRLTILPTPNNGENMNEEQPMTLARLTKVRQKIRAERDRLTAEFNAKDMTLKQEQDEIEREMIRMLNDTGIDSAKTEFGQVRKVVNQRFWSTDWSEFKKFVKENDALDLFEHRIAQKNMAAFLEANPDKLPAGLQIDRRLGIVVTKPRTKLE